MFFEGTSSRANAVSKRLTAERLTSRASGDGFWGRSWSSPSLARASKIAFRPLRQSGEPGRTLSR
jgi:hypothetical protein